jgi:hypothetical protein
MAFTLPIHGCVQPAMDQEKCQRILTGFIFSRLLNR